MNFDLTVNSIKYFVPLLFFCGLVCAGIYVAPMLMTGADTVKVDSGNIEAIEVDVIERVNRVLGEIQIVNAVDWAKATRVRLDGLTSYIHKLNLEEVPVNRSQAFKDQMELVVAPLLEVELPGDKIRAVLDVPIKKLCDEVGSIQVGK